MRNLVSVIILLSVSALFSAPGDLIWKFSTGGGYSSPCVSDGVVYVGNSYLYAIYCNGDFKWKYRIDNNRSSPCVSEGVVYIGDGEHAYYKGYLYAINCSDGTLKWRYKIGDAVESSPCVSDGVVYVGSGYQANNEGYLYAINSSDGTLKWRYKTGDAVVSSPCVSDGVVYFESYPYLDAINCADGTFKWRYRTGGAISSPCVSDGVVYVGSDDAYLYAINCADGTLKWKYETDDNVNSSPCVSDGVVYIGSWDYHLYAINCADGTLKWRYKTGYAVASSPCVSDGVVYVGSEDYYLYAINCSNGIFIWRYRTSSEICSSPCVSDGVVYIGNGYYEEDNHYLYAIETMEPGDTVIKVDTPNGGEEWLIGSVHDIIWGSVNVDSVSIKYTSDGGALWTEIARMSANECKYSWIIPDTPSEDCLVRINDIKGNVTDTSDSTFTIKKGNDFKNYKSASYLPSLSFSISPNPFSSRLSVTLPSSGAVYSITGQLIMKIDKGKYELDTSKWREGVYIVKSGKECKRVVKVRM